MLPFDNKNEFQVIINMPEGSSLETDGRGGARDRRSPSPRTGSHRLPDLRRYVGAVQFQRPGAALLPARAARTSRIYRSTCVGKGERSAQSHDIAKRVRPRVQEVAKRFTARVAVAEVPPGPPVLQTLVAEIYGPTDSSRTQLARRGPRRSSSQRRAWSMSTPIIEDDQRKLTFVIDHEKAALHGITRRDDRAVVQAGGQRYSGRYRASQNEREDIALILELPRAQKTSRRICSACNRAHMRGRRIETIHR